MRHKGFVTYLMGKVFQSDKTLEHVKVYAVTRLIHKYTPSDYEEPESQYSDIELHGQILKNTKDDKRGGKPRCPTFRKVIKHIKEYIIQYKLIHYVYLYFVTDIPDPFFEYMKFIKYKNQYGDLVDDAEFFIYGSQVSAGYSQSIRLSSIKKLNICCGFCMIDRNTKYSLAKRGDTKGLYGKKKHYG